MCVTWNGETYIPTTSAQGRVITPRDLKFYNIGTISDLYSGVITHSDRAHLLYEWLQGNKQKVAKPRGDTVISSTEADDAAYVQYLADHAFILDGQMWQRISGLHCEVFGSRMRDGGEILFAKFDYSKNEGKNWRREWEGRQGNWADEIRISINDIHRAQALGDAPIYHQFHNLEVFDPAAFDFDTCGGFVKRFFDEFLHATQSGVGEWGADLLGQWLDIRDAASGSAPMKTDFLSMLDGLRGMPIGREGERVLDDGFKAWEKLKVLIEWEPDPKPLPQPNYDYPCSRMLW